MRNFRISPQSSFAPVRWSISLVLGFTMAVSAGPVVRAESPDTAPRELKEVLREIETAANNKDVEGVMQFYDANFQHSDGMRRNSFSEALSQMWENYPRIEYRIELLSWEREGGELVAETVTEIEASQRLQTRLILVSSRVRSRQYFLNQKLVRQEILAEKTEVTSGSNPPEVKVILPDRVRVGEEFDFDVIVQEPLGENLLLGTAIEEKIENLNYLNPTSFELELLSAGGIFKRVTAPEEADNRWFSAIIVRADGITMITRRVLVEN